MFLKINKIFWLCCCLLLLPGCWDNRNIEELSIEIGTAFDKVDTDNEQANKHPLKVTIQDVAITPGPTQPKQDMLAQSKKYTNFVGTGDTVLSILRDFTLEHDRPSFGQHLKVIIIGEQLAKEVNLNVLLDLFTRTHEVRESCILLVSHGKAEEALKGGQDEFPAFHLYGIQKNRYKTPKLLSEITLGTARNKMAGRSSYVIQGLEAKNGQVRFNSGAIIKGNTRRMIGFLNEHEIIGLNWLLGDAQGMIKVKNNKNNQYFVYEISSVKTNITPHVEGKRIWFDVKIESTGRLHEDWYLHADAFDNRYMKQLEYAVQKDIEQSVRKTLYQIQRKYRADVADFGDQLRIHYPETWQQVKSNWDTTFSKAPVKLQVKVQIDDYFIKGRKET